jgi:hypothetical protein
MFRGGNEVTCHEANRRFPSGAGEQAGSCHVNQHGEHYQRGEHSSSAGDW